MMTSMLYAAQAGSRQVYRGPLQVATLPELSFEIRNLESTPFNDTRRKTKSMIQEY